jgi:hypothetical protein
MTKLSSISVAKRLVGHAKCERWLHYSAPYDTKQAWMCELTLLKALLISQMQLRVNTIRTCDAISSRKQVDRQLESSCNVTCSVITRSLHVHGPRAQKSERSERRSKRSERNVNETFDATLLHRCK